MAIASVPGVAAQPLQAPALQALQAPAQAAPAAQARPAAFYDPADANQDGIVTPAEALAYALAHPIAELLKAARAGAATYGATGAAAQGPPATTGLNVTA